MKQNVREAFNHEIEQAIKLYKLNEFNVSFSHLERAHILGQPYIIPHTLSHWWMLKLGWKKRDYHEVFGQFARIIASILFSKIWVPVGNTGGSDVNPLKPMPIPEDLQKILDGKYT